MDALHLIWCSKEAVYKAYGQKEVDYKRHIQIYREGLLLKAKLTKLDVSIIYDLEGRIIDKLYVVRCRQVSG